MQTHHLVTAGRGHLCIYAEFLPQGESIPSLKLVESVDLAGNGAGPNPGKVTTAVARLFAGEINNFFTHSSPTATWDLAATPGFHRMLLKHVTPSTRRRLKNLLAEDLTKLPRSRRRMPFLPLVLI